MSYVYGLHAVDALLRKEPERIDCLYLQKERRDKRITALQTLAENQGVAVQRVSRGQLDERIAGRHQGALAELRAVAGATGDDPESKLWSEAQLMRTLAEKADPALVLVLDGVTDPHNLGACLRSADAAGVDAVVVPKDNSASITPVVRKVACGAAESVSVVRVTNLSRTLRGMKDAGLWIYGADGEAATTIYAQDLCTPLALVLGAEGKGLRRLTREHCDVLVSLPMAGTVASLNVSVAAGICLFEVVRQRRG